MKRAVQRIKKEGIAHTEYRKNNHGKAVMDTKAPVCLYRTKNLGCKSAMWALWPHLGTSSDTEAAAAAESGERSGMVHPGDPMMRQLERWWQRGESRGQEEALRLQ